MRERIKKLRNNIFINRFVALLIKVLGIRSVAPQWPLKGFIKINIFSIPVWFYSDCDDHLISRYFYFGFDEEIYELDLLSRYVEKAKVFFDIGSYNGLFSIYYGKRYPNLKVFAFEPNPANFNRITLNLFKNKLHNVNVKNIGISSNEGSLDFYVPSDDSLTTVSSFNRSFLINHSNSTPKAVSVTTRSLQSFCEEEGTFPDVIKIDVEDHEYEVICGAMGIIKKYRPIILCEIFTMSFDTDIEFQQALPRVHFLDDFFRGIKYQIFVTVRNQLVKVDSLNTSINSGRNFLFMPE
jgi:FkbM family methyltransferase